MWPQQTEIDEHCCFLFSNLMEMETLTFPKGFVSSKNSQLSVGIEVLFSIPIDPKNEINAIVTIF